jgi:hypothetical protein
MPITSGFLPSQRVHDRMQIRQIWALGSNTKPLPSGQMRIGRRALRISSRIAI